MIVILVKTSMCKCICENECRGQNGRWWMNKGMSNLYIYIYVYIIFYWILIFFNYIVVFLYQLAAWTTAGMNFQRAQRVWQVTIGSIALRDIMQTHGMNRRNPSRNPFFGYPQSSSMLIGISRNHPAIKGYPHDYGTAGLVDRRHQPCLCKLVWWMMSPGWTAGPWTDDPKNDGHRLEEA